MEIIKYILFYVAIGIALSIDAFMVCMAYGLGQHKKYILILTPFAVGSFHIIFPIIACILYGVLNLHNYGIGRYLSSTIFICLGLVNLLKSEDHNPNQVLSIIKVIVLAIAVSIDSFFVGFSISTNKYIFFAAIIFGITSFTFTCCSIFLAKTLNNKINFDMDLIIGIFFILLGILSFHEVF